VLAQRQRDFRLGLAGAEMQVIEIIGDRLVEWRQFRVDEKVMVSGIVQVFGRRSDGLSTR
jgi:hypothetical protein